MAKKRGIHFTDITDQGLTIAETNISEEQADSHQDEDAPGGETDPILDYINSQHHQDDDMNHGLQAYNIMTSSISDTTPQRSINSVHTHLFYHVAQAKQAQHGSLVDRGANGCLAGSDVRILSKSSRKMHCYWDRSASNQWARYCAVCSIGENKSWLCQPYHE